MKKIVIVYLLFLVLCSQAQAPKNFYTKFGNAGIDVAYSVKQTLDRQYIVAGSTTSFGFGNTDFILLKIDSMGPLIWQKNYGGFLNDVARSVIQLADSGYVITGFTNSFGSGGYDVLTIRTDKFGNIIWQRNFGGSDWEYGYDIIEAGDGGIVICGSTSSFGSGKNDGLVIKYDLLGNLIWQKYFGGAEDDELKAIIKTNDNNLATVGINRSIHDLGGDCYFIKLKNDGDTLFTRYNGGIYKDGANDLVQKPTGDFVIGAATTTSINAKTRSLMYCMTNLGIPLWTNTVYFGPDTDEEWVTIASSLKKPDYTAYIRNDQIPAFKQQGTIFYTPSPGLGEITNSNGGIENETIYCIEGTKDGGFVSVGITSSFGSQNGDIYFIKQDTNIINYANAVGIAETVSDKNFVFLHKSKSKLFKAENPHVTLFDTYSVYDLTGNLVRQVSCQSEYETIDLSDFCNSIYLLMFSKKNNVIYKTKIIND